mmetsp:Transcript_2734/g.5202  ORF Transcript_2734/g.5202 Transcript_2734/m.5202 type:complete len:86 (-) Transcript_2734:458-715(-)
MGIRQHHADAQSHFVHQDSGESASPSSCAATIEKATSMAPSSLPPPSSPSLDQSPAELPAEPEPSAPLAATKRSKWATFSIRNKI